MPTLLMCFFNPPFLKINYSHVIHLIDFSLVVGNPQEVICLVAKTTDGNKMSLVDFR